MTDPHCLLCRRPCDRRRDYLTIVPVDGGRLAAVRLCRRCGAPLMGGDTDSEQADVVMGRVRRRVAALHRAGGLPLLPPDTGDVEDQMRRAYARLRTQDGGAAGRGRPRQAG